ncbi:hypothetical protein Q669_10150 [Labrenzia sp. C1B10]|jgi:hypothetical protein|uniref:hypothetical protein n=1 Tax=Stappiaceae TaxID=2821832 RepID=UPI0003B8D54F|nr:MULTISPECIES: hypothetical protein [unclassified Labrenzia]ERP88812.1 hypothetical protein Q669_10150 [Labrenzia sp. C1B10]ERP99241.1 hypothetical protein Q675_11760 [Labrenzia sp. C1B70]
MTKDLFISLFYVAVFYFFGGFTILNGCPPFYKESKPVFAFNSPTKDEVLEGMHFMLGASGVVLAAVFLSLLTGLNLHLALSAGCLYGGWSIRAKLKRTSDGPLPWVAVYTASPLLFRLFDRRPMLLFDIWTLAVAGVFGLPLVAFALMKG